ncbi:MAG: IS3 family transposase, partial [Christensenellaceae bacterium]|nr:IS3 family transposase [Christensenellaceae bacterium]
MSRIGRCIYNGPMEGLFGILKTEIFYLDSFLSEQELRTTINNYIDFYNNGRFQENLNGMMPIQFRNQPQCQSRTLGGIGRSITTMAKDLTTSKIDRRNILNNDVALAEIQKMGDFKAVLWEGKLTFTRDMVADFFGVDIRTISRYVKQN